jgi:hypothetical protein
MAVTTMDTATMCVALIAWIVATVWLLNSAARTERGLWELRKNRPVPARKTAQSVRSFSKRAA